VKSDFVKPIAQLLNLALRIPFLITDLPASFELFNEVKYNNTIKSLSRISLLYKLPIKTVSEERMLKSADWPKD
jgi:hypothetical protein